MKILIITLLLLSQTAFATSSDILFHEGRNSVLGRANSITNAGAYAAKTNPASLALNEKARLGFNLSLSSPELDNTDLSPVTSTPSGISKDNYKASDSEAFKAYAMGASLPLGKKLTVGVAAFLSANAFIRIFTQTSNESNYLTFNDRQQRPEIYTSASYKLNDQWSFGGGIYHSMKAIGTFQMGVSTTDAEGRSLLEAKPVMVPFVGALYSKKLEENKRLLAGVSYRGVNDPETEITIDLRQSVPSATVPVNVNSSLVAFYDPAQLSLGTGYETNRFSTYLSVERVFWSKFKSPIIEIGGDDIQTISGGKIDEKPNGFKDIWVLRYGQEIKNVFSLFGGNYTQLFGLEYHQGTMDEQTSSLAILDTDKFVLSLGGETKFDNLVENAKVAFFFGLKYIKLKDSKFSATSKTNIGQTARAGGSVIGIAGGLEVEI